MSKRKFLSEIIDEDGNVVRPVIVQFQNSTLREGEEEKLRTAIYKKSANKRLAAAATNEILYKGNIIRDESKYSSTNKFLVISNRKTGKTRILAVDMTTLTPWLNKKSEKSNDTLDKTADDANVSAVYKLNKEFGSKKIKRITEQRERLKMDIEDAKEQLEQTVAAIEVEEPESFVIKPVENESAYRPPINREAPTREQVYVLDEIVPEHVLESLQDEANNMLSSDYLDEFNLSPFIKEHMIQLQNSSVPDQIRKCELLLYINYLITYINQPAKAITKRFVICQTSTDVNNQILDNFSVPSSTGGRTRPFSMRDKTICYILVLSMLALDYQVDLESLSKNVKVGVKKLQEIGRVLAFSQHGKNKSTMVLKFPLPPAVSLSPRKRRSK